jgi:hypothetical protein
MGGIEMSWIENYVNGTADLKEAREVYIDKVLATMRKGIIKKLPEIKTIRELHDFLNEINEFILKEHKAFKLCQRPFVQRDTEYDTDDTDDTEEF